MNQVRFFFGSLDKYMSLAEKNPLALYFINDDSTGQSYLYKGSELIAAGHLATKEYMGLMSAEDKAKLEELSSAGSISNLSPVDGTISVTDTDEGKAIGVKISRQDGNALTAVEDGLFVPRAAASEHSAYVPGSGIDIADDVISVKIAESSHGLTAVDGEMAMLLATSAQDGAMSKEDKAFLDSVPTTYASKRYVSATAEQVKFEVTSLPVGTLVNYSDEEIRIMCTSDAAFTKQAVGSGGDPNSYYATLKTYAPENAVGYIEYINGQPDDAILRDLSTDEFGRKYQPTWLALAKYDDTTSSWSYYGKNSSRDKYIGWDYRIDWYNTDGVKTASDNIRINLSNEDCHYASTPYYISTLKAEMNNTMSWGELE